MPENKHRFSEAGFGNRCRTRDNILDGFVEFLFCLIFHLPNYTILCANLSLTYKVYFDILLSNKSKFLPLTYRL